MRIGFLGVGGIAHSYRNSLRRLGQPVAAVCDTAPERLRAVADEEQAAAFDEFDAMLAQADLEALFVCIPPFAHVDQVSRAAERGIHLFVAKPVALTLDTAARTRDAVAAAGVINQSGYMWRSSDAVREARRQIGEQAITLALGQVLVGCPGTPWWRVRAQSGGQVLEQSTHILDLMRFLVGEVREVTAAGHTGALSDLTDFEDSTVGLLRFDSGAVGTLASTHTGGFGRYQLALCGRDLAVEIDAAHNRVHSRDGDYQGDEDGYFRQVETFLAACAAGDQSLIPTDYADAVRSLAVSVAFNESMATGAPVAPREV